MKLKQIYKMINEEVSEFDFLGMSNVSLEKEHDKLLNSKEFQTNLIKDIVTNLQDKNKFKKVSATYVNKIVDSDFDVEDIELEIELTYNFHEKNYELIIFISGEKEDDDLNVEDFNFKLFSKAGDQITMKWIEKNENLYKKFITNLISPYLD